MLSNSVIPCFRQYMLFWLKYSSGVFPQWFGKLFTSEFGTKCFVYRMLREEKGIFRIFEQQQRRNKWVKSRLCMVVYINIGTSRSSTCVCECVELVAVRHLPK